MAQPTFVPITEADQVRAALRLSVPGRWTADRPADLAGPNRPTGARFGTPGPDQGYAMRLAKRFEDRLQLGPSESVDDVLAGASIVASKRAGLLGRAPCIYDLEAAFAIFGFLLPDPPEGLVAERRRLFASVSYDYVAQRTLADAVPDETLRLRPEEIVSRSTDWRSLLNLGRVPENSG